MSLPEHDVEYLAARGINHELQQEAGMTCVVFPAFSLPAGLSHASAKLLVRLQAGYPDLPPDMWWFSPRITLANGVVIPATEQPEFHLGREWQRWSRHLQPAQWRSGIDGLENYLALIRRELERSVLGMAS